MNSIPTVWELLVDSGLIQSSLVGEVKTRYESSASKEKKFDSETILGWLKNEKRISGYQRDVLLGGIPGPFLFEQYRIHTRDKDPDTGQISYRGQHVGSQHPVRIFFVEGDDIQAATQWAETRLKVDGWRHAKSRLISRIYECVEFQDFRMIVTEDRPGKPLTKRLPPKGRLPWPQTCQAAEQLAIALAEVHHVPTTHGRICPDAVWLQRGGNCQLKFQVPGVHYDPNDEATNQALARFISPVLQKIRAAKKTADLATQQRCDLFSLGCLIFRLLTGSAPSIKATDSESRQPELEKHLAHVTKLDLPESLSHLLRLLLNADVSTELKDAAVTSKLLGTIVGTQSLVHDVEPDLPTMPAFQNSLNQKVRSSQFFDTLESFNGTTVPASTTAKTPTAIATKQDFLKPAPPSNLNDIVQTIDADPSDSPVRDSAREQLARRKNAKSKNKTPLYLGAGIAIAAVGLGLLLTTVFSDKSESASSESNGDETNKETEVERPTIPVALTRFRPQRILPDDGKMLWESPTGNEPLDVQWIPAAPEFIFSFRPNRLTNNPHASRFLKAMGPRFQQLQNQFFAFANIEPEQVERLTISLHPNSSRQYSVLAVVEFADVVTKESLWGGLGKPAAIEHPESGHKIWKIKNQSILLLPKEGDQVSTIVIGQDDLLEQAFASSGIAAVGATMENLLRQTDRDRDVNILFRNSALTSEEGTWLFDGPLANLRRPLHLFFDDRMKGTLFSLHFDEASYLELRTDQTTDFTKDELLDFWPKRFQSTRDEIAGYAGQLPPHPYWSQVQPRLDRMMGELIKNIRYGQQKDGVVLNCWLPEMAPHNLLVAGELALNGSRLGATGVKVTNANVPETLEQLLAEPRDIKVTSNPDLVVLMRDIEKEIRDDYPTLPFEFRIRLLGADLAVEGITQNQRPGLVEAKQQSLSQILTQIMLQANPDKSATSPADENCKLIWVIGPDPDEPTKTAVLVTTRKAAVERNMTIPKVFTEQ